MASERLAINLADPNEVQAKLPEIARLLDAKRAELMALQTQVALLARLVGTTPAVLDLRPARADSSGSLEVHARRKAAPGQDRAVAGLEKAGRPMTPKSLFDFMVSEGMDVPDNANALGANLWAAERAGRIGKTPNGVYVPPGLPADRPLTDYDVAAEQGLPVPSEPWTSPEGDQK
jgi:hypothetical protein